MIRSFLRLSGRIVVSMALSCTLIPIASADEPASPPASEATAAPSETGSADAGTPQKNLDTVPEDGLGDTKWLSGATKVVRDLQAARPNEDLIICIGGCLSYADRVIYSQPAEPPEAKPVKVPAKTVSDAAPAASPATKTEESKPAPSAQKAEAEKKPAFVPSMSTPKTPSEAAPESTPKTGDASSPAADSPAADLKGTTDAGNKDAPAEAK